MDLFKRQKSFVDGLRETITSSFRDSINDFDFVVKDYIVNKQLFREGIDGDGEKLEGYGRTTIRLKLAKGDPADRTTLRDTGEFHADIEVKAFNDHFEVSYTVSHGKWLVQRYGEKILKVENDNMREFFKNFVIPKIKENVNNEITR